MFQSHTAEASNQRRALSVRRVIQYSVFDAIVDRTLNVVARLRHLVEKIRGRRKEKTHGNENRK